MPIGVRVRAAYSAILASGDSAGVGDIRMNHLQHLIIEYGRNLSTSSTFSPSSSGTRVERFNSNQTSE
ncbi:MAG TPA: hypothetical protein VK776_10010 [Bryobacteraceae bacterium]|nr:hypothetical protein [Bryobacteraceae bacterium]